MTIVNSDELLEQAGRLIRGAPRQADLRRAISAAYYAVFHAVATQAADDLAGKARRKSTTYAVVYRSLGHSQLAKFCDEAKKQNLPQNYAPYAPQGGFGDELRSFAGALIQLQRKRNEADYDPLFIATASDAQVSITAAQGAIENFRNANQNLRRAFVTLCILPPRSPR